MFIIVANLLLNEELISHLFVESDNYILDLFCNNNFFEPFDNDQKVIAYVTNIEMVSNSIGIDITVFIIQIFDSNNV